MTSYDELETTAQRVYRYLRETIKDEPRYVNYSEIAEEVGRTRSAVSYAVNKLIKAGKIAVEGGKLAVIK